MIGDPRDTGDDVTRSIIAVDEFYFVNDEVDVFQYGVVFTWCDSALLREFIAIVIDDCSSIGVPFDEIHGTNVLSSIYALAAHHEVGVHVIPYPIVDDDTIVLVAHSDGGVHLAIGDGDAWDATMWHLRFGPRAA